MTVYLLFDRRFVFASGFGTVSTSVFLVRTTMLLVRTRTFVCFAKLWKTFSYKQSDFIH